MSAVAASPEEKRVGWAELFFDLVFVVAVTRVSTLLEHDRRWGGLRCGRRCGRRGFSANAYTVSIVVTGPLLVVWALLEL